MAHYALLDENNIVVSVIPGRDEEESFDWENLYSQETGMRCLRTSYNTYKGVHSSGGEPFRYNYAGIGMIYRDDLDAFIYPSPFNGWVFDEQSMTWIAPEVKPDSIKELRQKTLVINGEDKVIEYNAIILDYYWDNDLVSWVQISEEDFSNEEKVLKYKDFLFKLDTM